MLFLLGGGFRVCVLKMKNRYEYLVNFLLEEMGVLKKNEWEW